MMERKVTEIECFSAVCSDDYALEICIRILDYAVAVAEPALGIEVMVHLEGFFRELDVKDSVKGKGEERIPCNVPYDGVPAALEEFDAVGLNCAD